MPLTVIINSLFTLAEFVLDKIKENTELKNKDKQQLIKYFEEKFSDINSRLKELHK